MGRAGHEARPIRLLPQPHRSAGRHRRRRRRVGVCRGVRRHEGPASHRQGTTAGFLGRNEGTRRRPVPGTDRCRGRPSGEVYVVDDLRDDIQVFSADGTYRRTIGGPGSAPGQLRDTGNIRIDGQGNLLNADFGNGRVQAWDDKGRLLWTLGSKGTGPGQFTEPQDVAFGPDGHLLVVDDGRVQVFNVQRELVGVWPADPSPDHLGALALDGDHLWVEAPYPNKLFELKVSWTSSTARVAPTGASDQPNSPSECCGGVRG